jgi:AraC-like DNA-binding protein
MNTNEFDNIVPTINYFINRIGNSNWKIIQSKIDFHDLTYIYKGKATYIINNKKFHVSEGDYIYIPDGSVREAYTYADNPISSYACNFFCHTDKNIKINLPIPNQFRIGKSIEIMEFYGLLNNIWLEKGFGYKLGSRALFMLILQKIITILNYSNVNIKFDKRIKFIKEYILNNYDKNLNLKDLAQMVNLNHIYFGKLFKECTGLSLNSYIQKIRINSAENLLLNNEFTVSETAYHCGFNDIYYFSKVYKKYKGYPPSKSLYDK